MSRHQLRHGLRQSGVVGQSSGSFDLPTANRLAFWYAGDGSAQPSDVVTVSPGDAQLINSWASKTGGYNPAQATTAAKPTYRMSVSQLNGRAAVEGDGGDYLSQTLAATIVGALNVYTIYVVYRSASTLPQLYMVNEGSSTNALTIVAPQLAGDNTSGKLSFRHRDDAGGGPNINSTATDNANDGTCHLVTLRRISANSWSLRLDGVQVGTSVSAAGTTTADRLSLLARVFSSASQFFVGQVAMVALYSADNYQTIEPLITAHYPVGMGARQTGAWTWFNDSRAIRVSGKTYLGYMAQDGSVESRVFDHASAKVTDRFTLKARMEQDDHDNPAFLVRASDNKIMAFYSLHSGISTFMRISSSALDITAWAAEVNLDSQLGLAIYAYANPVQLTGEVNTPIYLFQRGEAVAGHPAQYYSKSSDDGATWAASVRWVDNSDRRVYLKLARNGTTRIDFALSDGNPEDAGSMNLWHGYYSSGNVYKSDGTLVGALASGPYAISSFTKVYDGSVTKAWCHAIAIDGSNNPVIVYANFPSTTDHRYRYAKWSGSAWVDGEICTAGTYLYAAQLYYSGGVTIDPADVNTVYASRDTGDGIHQIWRYVTADGGSTWTATQLTTGAFRCIRPFVVPGHSTDYKLVYLRGRYTTYTDYDTEIIMSNG